MLEFEIITIGDEILNGTIVDTNSAWLGQQVQRYGLAPYRRQTVPDVIEDIVAALDAASKRATLVVCSGGLGPTVDDITAEAAAKFLGVSTTVNAEALEQIKAWRKAAGKHLNALDDRQAQLPEGATAIQNPVGTAPGFSIEKENCKFYFFPGVPREWKTLCERHIFPELQHWVGAQPEDKTWKFFGYTESQLAMLVEDLDTRDLELHYRVHFPEIHLRAVSGSAERVQIFEEALMDVAGERYFGSQDDSFAGTVNTALERLGWTLATAESCTGGLVSQMITSIPGASRVFTLGAVTYSNEAKHAILGVDNELLIQHGAVSQPVVEAMARGARERAGSTLGVAISGIAGPGGGTAEKPVGTVHFALATPENVIHKKRNFRWERDRVQKIAAYVALQMVRSACLSKSGDW